MATPVIVSRVRATLHRQGYQGFTQEKILEAANSLNVDINNPTPEDTKAVAQILQKTVAQDETKIVTAPTANVDSENAVNQEQLDMLPSAEPASLVNYQQTTEMVAHQAQEMGVVLSTNDIQQISDNISGQTTDADEINAEIREAISHFIQFHKAQSLNKVSTLVRDVYREQSEANREVSEALASGLQQFSRDMEESRQHTKSTFRNALKCFAIPTTEA